MMPKRKTFLKNHLINYSLLVAALLLTFLGCEAALRVLDIGDPAFKPRFNEGSSCRYDPVLGWSGIPHLKKVDEYDGELGSVAIDLNDIGFRDDHHKPEKAPGVKRLLFLGDSFTVGFGMPVGHRFTDIVQQHLQDGYEVLNMGLWGYSTDQYLLTLKETGVKYKPDIVVTGLFLDDPLTDNAFTRFRARYIKPKYRLTDDDRLELINVPVPNNRSASYLYNVLVSRYLELRNRFEIGDTFYRAGFPANLIDLEYYRQGHFNLTLRLIKELNAVATEHNSLFLLVIIPMEFQLYEREYRETGKQLFEVPLNRRDIFLTQKVVTRFCRENGIPVLDLLPGFIQFGRTSALYFNTDLHFNRQGHSLAAGLILHYLTENGFLK